MAILVAVTTGTLRRALPGRRYLARDLFRENSSARTVTRAILGREYPEATVMEDERLDVSKMLDGLDLQYHDVVISGGEYLMY
jgi:hypothetical protein